MPYNCLDFKQQLKALEMLSEHCGTDIDGLISNLDLLLKWMTLRFFETNPSVNIKGKKVYIWPGGMYKQT